MIVVDASAAVEMIVRGPASQRVADRVLDAGVALHAPYLLDLEVTQVLRRYLRGREITSRRAGYGLDWFLDLPINRHPHSPFIPRVWQLRGNLTAYDAAYISLAEALGAQLVTLDQRLARSGGHSAVVELLQP